ncbi:hypothetical protein [Mycobacteroides abscessus]|uniref:hypothetical protein n=1 Tax=Mycobacteroides abscessus TaxID=36809 RepID=UPI0018A5A6C7|nr:hypothetical protein [Mycobacteroides abscessus]QOF34651.1 hypothetical protein E3G57_003567 [Mycobacteroides abscessus]
MTVSPHAWRLVEGSDDDLDVVFVENVAGSVRSAHGPGDSMSVQKCQIAWEPVE